MAADTGFQHMIKVLKPGYKMPSPRHFMNTANFKKRHIEELSKSHSTQPM